MDASSPKNQKLFFIAILAVVLFGIVLRYWVLINLHDYWYDEVVTAEVISHPISEEWNYLQYENSPPLYYYLLKIWSDIVGNTETRLRLFSFLFGLLSLPAIYALGSEFFSKRVGAISAALMSISSLLIFHQTEARMYSLFFFLLIMSIYFFWRIVKGADSFLAYSGYFIFTLASLYSHLTALPLLAIEAIFLFFYPSGSKKMVYATMALCFVLFLPWLAQFIARIASIRQAGLGAGWYFNLVESSIPFILYVPVGFIFEQTIPLFTVLLIAAMGYLMLQSFFDIDYSHNNDIGVLKFVKAENQSLFFLALLFFGPLLVSAISLNLPTLRYYLPSAIAFFILISRGINGMAVRRREFFTHPVSLIAAAILVALILANARSIFDNRESWNKVIDFARINGVKSVLVSPSELGGLLVKHYLEPAGLNVIIPFVDPEPGDASGSMDYLAYNIKYNWNWMSLQIKDGNEAEAYRKAVKSAINSDKLIYIYENKPKEIFVRGLIEKNGYGCVDSTHLMSKAHYYYVIFYEKGANFLNLKCMQSE